MKFPWIWAALWCAILFVLSVQAEENVNPIEAEEDNSSVSKLLNEVDDKGEDGVLDDEIIEDSDSNIPSLITDKDIQELKDPNVQRLARHLKSFHNQNVQRSNDDLNLVNEEIENVKTKVRANPRRQKIRRRNLNNKRRRNKRNRLVANQKNGNQRRRMKNQKNKNFKVKNLKKRRRNQNQNRRLRNRRNNNKQRKQNQNRRLRRRNNMNRKRNKNAKRNNGQMLAKKSINKKNNVHNGDRHQSSEKENVEPELDSNVVRH